MKLIDKDEIMSKDINIKLSADRVSAAAGEKIRIKATFDKLAYASVNERREKEGYQNVIRTQDKVQGIDIEATVHQDTTDFIVLTDASGVPHLNENQYAVAAWYHVTVVKDDEPTPEPEPTPVDLGKYLYSVGLLSDFHISKDSNEWWDEDDFRRCLYLYAADKNVKCIMGCGDLLESGSPKKATPDNDSKDFIDLYDVAYWQVAGLRLFSPMGNHDYYGIFESRSGDEITGAKNTETIFGYNATVASRISKIWPTGQQINGIVPGRGRIVFELENGKPKAEGQADMRFFSYNDYVDLYARKGGYDGTSIWDANKGGISDEAIVCAKNYVKSNWAETKDSLIMWNDGGSHGRNGYSKLSYWLKKDNDIFIHLSLDYGNDVWTVNDNWHDRMIRARTIIDVNSDDPYIRRMMEYVADTGYSKADEPYNYQYYSPNSLIWLKEILEGNRDKKRYLFMHHFMTNRSGNGAGVPKDGNWFYSAVHHSGEKDPREGNIYNMGSNALTGVQFWFFEKLLREHRNIIVFTGHSHISFGSGINFDNHTYNIVSPEEKNEYVYTRANEVPVAETAMCVALPSMSKPRDIINGQSVRRYQDAEMGVMEIYERGVIIKGYKVREDNKDVNRLLVEKTIRL